MSDINHIAIIMDGNGRWGLKKFNSRRYGHQRGIKTVEKIIEATIKKNVRTHLRKCVVSHLPANVFCALAWKVPLHCHSPTLSSSSANICTTPVARHASFHKICATFRLWSISLF